MICLGIAAAAATAAAIISQFAELNLHVTEAYMYFDDITFSIIVRFCSDLEIEKCLYKGCIDVGLWREKQK